MSYIQYQGQNHLSYVKIPDGFKPKEQKDFMAANVPKRTVFGIDEETGMETRDMIVMPGIKSAIVASGAVPQEYRILEDRD